MFAQENSARAKAPAAPSGKVRVRPVTDIVPSGATKGGGSTSRPHGLATVRTGSAALTGAPPDDVAAAAAKLLVDAQAAAGCVGNICGAALDAIGRGAQLDQGGVIEFLQREFAEEVRAMLRLEFGRDPEQALGANLTPIVEALLGGDLIGRPCVQGGGVRVVSTATIYITSVVERHVGGGRFGIFAPIRRD